VAYRLQNVKSVKQIDIAGTVAYLYRSRSRTSSTGSLWVVTTMRPGLGEVLLSSQMDKVDALTQATRHVERGTYSDTITRNISRVE